MKRFLRFMMLPLLLVSCSKDGPSSEGSRTYDDGAVEHEMIVLGKKLDNPYTTGNMQSALASVYPTKSRVEVKTTHLYVRFLPRNQDEFDLLKEVELTDHPLDYEIIKDGDYYHDPSIGDDAITWQYAVVPHDFVFPDVKYELLDECFITENDAPVRSGDGIDWEAVEREAYRITGNGGMLARTSTKGSKVNPSGRITIVDEDVNGGKPFGVAGVRVRCNTFVKFSSAYTDRDGYYTIPKKYSSNLRYRLVFKNDKGFAIGFNLLLVPASTSALGKASPEGLNVTVTKDSDRKLFTRCVTNNAAYDYITRCSEEDMDIALPPSDLRIWLFPGLEASSAVMLHHGAFLKNEYITRFLGVFSSIIAFFAPDITIGTKSVSSYRELYSSVCHEMAHASHFSQVGKSYWDKYILFIMKSYLTSGGMTYGTGEEADAGYCEIGEMWAYYLESVMYKERYGGNVPSFGTSFWFYPQILRYLDERGIERSDIIKAMQPEVKNRALLQESLLAMYPSKRGIINQVFTRYR